MLLEEWNALKVRFTRMPQSAEAIRSAFRPIRVAMVGEEGQAVADMVRFEFSV